MMRLLGLLTAGLLLAGLLSALSGCSDGYTKKQLQAAASAAYSAGYDAGQRDQKKQDDLEAMQRAHTLENAATAGNVCNLFGSMSRALCPRGVLQAGDAAIAAGATPAAWLLSLWMLLVLSFYAAGFAAFGGTLYWLSMRWLAPARREVQEAQKLVETAQLEAGKARDELNTIERDILLAKRELQNAQKQAQEIRQQIKESRAELSSIERKIAQRKRDNDELLGGFS
jgi:hypothetical protein